jgi:hypothetical protein
LAKRIHVTANETEILKRSGRRCCLCFGLHRDMEVKQGQIAHIDRNPANSAVSNLVFLCLKHHDQYDTRTSQSKGWTEDEVISYQEELHIAVETFRSMGSEKMAYSLDQFVNAQLTLYAGITQKIDQLTNQWQEFQRSIELNNRQRDLFDE